MSMLMLGSGAWGFRYLQLYENAPFSFFLCWQVHWSAAREAPEFLEWTHAVSLFAPVAEATIDISKSARPHQAMHLRSSSSNTSDALDSSHGDADSRSSRHTHSTDGDKFMDGHDDPVSPHDALMAAQTRLASVKHSLSIMAHCGMGAATCT